VTTNRMDDLIFCRDAQRAKACRSDAVVCSDDSAVSIAVVNEALRRFMEYLVNVIKLFFV